MTLNKSSWHYRLWRYYETMDGFSPAKSTNLCSYVQQIFWCTIISVIGYTVMFPLYIAFAHPPTSHEDGCILVAWKGWSVGNFVLKPWYIAMPLYLGMIEYLWWARDMRTAAILHGTIGAMVVIAALLCLVMLFTTGRLDDKNETIKLIREWLAAKKAGYCPIIDFKDAE
jgi:hypothetical protein